MTKRTRMMAAAAIAAMALIGAVLWGALRSRHQPADQHQNHGNVQALTLGTVSLAGAPSEVQEAAMRLMNSRVGYAMVRPDATYLIISTGSDASRVRIEGVEGQPMGGPPTFVDVNLASDGAGQRLLIATLPLTTTAEYQFNVDGMAAAIPTLHNRHNLPLVALPDHGGFVALSPVTDQVVAGGTIQVAGYARVFEAQFTVRVMTAKGRVIGEQHVMAAAGAPGWGSFAAQVSIDTANLPDTGFVVFEEEMTQSKLVVPVRFRAPTQLG